MCETNELHESLITTWIKLTGILKNTRITQGMIYNEAVVMNIVYTRYRRDGEGLVSFKDLISETRMVGPLVNRTIDSLVKDGLLVRCDGKDKRTTFVRPVVSRLGKYLEMHAKTLKMVGEIVDVIGEEDARAFIRLGERIIAADPLNS